MIIHITFKDLTPIRRMDIKDINVMLCDHSKTDKFFSMQISAPEEKHKKGKKSTKSTRNIFVHAETGKVCILSFLSLIDLRTISYNYITLSMPFYLLVIMWSLAFLFQQEIVEWFLAIRAARFKALGLSGAESDVIVFDLLLYPFNVILYQNNVLVTLSCFSFL